MTPQENNNGVVRVLITDDHAPMRRAVSRSLSAIPSIEVVGEADDGDSAVEKAQKTHPDVIIMDVSMPTMNGPEATRRIKALLPAVKVVALSNYSDQASVDSMLSAGATAYVVKERAAYDLAPAIEAVTQNGRFFSKAVSPDDDDRV